MSLHAGSAAMAHQLDRFSCSDFEEVSGDAARLGLAIDTIRCYQEWYGEKPVRVNYPTGVKVMPAWEAEVRWQVLGEGIRRCR